MTVTEQGENCGLGVSPDTQRKHLILDHLPQVHLIARRIHHRLPVSVSLDDLISAGILGLIAAVDHYQASHNVKLRTYAEYKIRGAILDSLRSQDWVPRLQRKRAKLIESAITVLTQKYHHVPSEEEIASHLHLPISDYHEWLSQARGLTLGSLENAGFDENGGNLLNYLPNAEEQWPSQIVEQAELECQLADALRKMPHLERTVLNLYYYEELTLREIARIVDLHESRISQLKLQAVLRLRLLMTKKRPLTRKAA